MVSAEVKDSPFSIQEARDRAAAENRKAIQLRIKEMEPRVVKEYNRGFKTEGNIDRYLLYVELSIVREELAQARKEAETCRERFVKTCADKDKARVNPLPW
jgi:hypothetical protein